MRYDSVLVLVLALAPALPTAALAQGPLDLAQRQEWPRWSAVPPQATPPAPDKVWERSFLGSIVGWVGGSGLGLAVCELGCGDDETDILAVVVLGGVIGGGVASAVLGCSTAHEDGCVGRVLPKALLGSLLGVAASTVVASTTRNGIAAWVTYSVTQAYFTARAIR